MKNGLLIKTMWMLYAPTFKSHLSIIDAEGDSKEVMKKAKKQYKEIIGNIPTFGKNDILLVNLISAAQIAAIYLSLDKKPTCEQMKEYYGKSMDDSRFMQLFLKSNHYYSAKYQNNLSKQATVSQNSDNPYSWRFKYYPGKSLDTFDAIFDRCGICHLFEELGISEITPAMCAYDYGMAKWTDTVFTRETTIAGGGRVCDCHYKRKSVK